MGFPGVDTFERAVMRLPVPLLSYEDVFVDLFRGSNIDHTISGGTKYDALWNELCNAA